jgi:hypothetical protein
MSKELAERVYRKHKDFIFGVVLTKHFFERFFERSNDLEELKKIYKHINRKLPEIVFDLALNDKTKVIVINGYRIPMLLDTDSYEWPVVIAKTMIK